MDLKKIKLTLFSVIVLFLHTLQGQEYQKGIVYAKVKESQNIYFNNRKERSTINLTQFLNLYEISPLIRHSFARASSEISEREKEVRKIYKLTFSENISVDEKINELLATGFFEIVEPAYSFDIQLGYQPNDSLADSLLTGGAGMNQLQLHDFYSAFAIEKGDTNVIIGIVDTGINFDQEDSKKTLKYNWKDLIDGINNDGDKYNGFELIDNFRGWDLGDNDNNPTFGPGASHGAAMASITSATPDNNLGMVGTGFNCSYKPYKVSANASPNNLTKGYDGMYLAALEGSKVILCSWGATNVLPKIFEELTTHLVLDLDALIISAAGNSGQQTPFFPASFPYVLSTCALKMDSTLLISASNYNYYVDLAAAGEYVRMSNGANSGYKTDVGTSASAAVVAGMAGLVRSHFPEMSALQARQQIKTSASYIDSIAGNKPYAGKIGKMIHPLNSISNNYSPGLLVIDQTINNGVNEFNRQGDVVSFDLKLYNALRPSKDISFTLTPISNNFSFLKSNGTLPDLDTKDTLFSLNQSIQLGLNSSNNAKEEYIARIDYFDGKSYKDHDYIFFSLKPTNVTALSTTESNDWEIYPTKITNFIHLEGNFKGNLEMELINVEGNVVFKTTHNNSNHLTVILPDSIANGSYLLKVKDQEKIKTTKIIKLY